MATLTASGQTSSTPEEEVAAERTGLVDTGSAAGRIAPSAGRRTAWLIVALVGLALVCLGSLMIGSLPISPAATLRALLAPDQSEAAQIVTELRVPRTLLGLAVGAALGVSGALIQALTRNPLADPGILGVNAGASLAIVVAVTFLGVTSLTEYIWFALLGAIVTTVAVYLIGSANRTGTASPIALVLAGVALGAAMQGVASGIALMVPRTFDQLRFWQAGRLTDRDLPNILAAMPFIAVGLLLAAFVPAALNAIALGDDQAVALGVRVGLVRVLVVVSVTLLCGTATALCGPIGFVGLMVPHVVRWLFGVDQRWILAFTVVLAPTLLLVSDIVGRLVMWPGDLAVGLVTAFIGAPVLIMLARRRQAAGL